MSSRELTIVVTCTDRKSLPTPANRQLRSVSPGAEQFITWTRRIASADTVLPLRSLYQGEAWSQLPKLEESARAAGFTPTTYVASAGLGLRLVTSPAPSYGATFAPNHPDSVRGSITEQRAWWNQLNQWSGTQGEFASSDQVLFVLSRRYADVLAPLVEATALARPTLVVGGSDAIDPSNRLATNVRLRATLGGTLGALNMRTAVSWLNRLATADIGLQHHLESWEQWAGEVGRLERYDRKPLDDAGVRLLIQEIRGEQSTISKTRALRSLRARGFACEQGRFARLFDITTGGVQ